MCCAYFCIILMLIFVGVFTLKRRSTFHPFFSVLLSLFLITYAIDDSLELCGIIMDITGFGKGRPREVIGQIEVVFYVYISPRALLLLLERITATLYFAKYENFRPWRIFFVIELLTLGTATAWCYIFRGLDTFRQWIMLGFEIVIILALILLLLLNRSRVRQSIGTGVLASRYQTAENICAIRILLAVILLDALVGLINIGGELLLSVGTTYDDEACSTRLGTIVFITMQVCCDALEACIPISVMVLHPSLKKMFKYHKKGISDDHEPRNHLQNVIGMRINFDQLSAENHFEGLRKAWN